MNERRLARLLSIVGMLVIGVMPAPFEPFDFRWSESGALAKLVFVVGATAAAVGIGLDVKHRREAERLQREVNGEPV